MCYSVVANCLKVNRRQLLTAGAVVATCLAAGQSAIAQETPDYFRQNCISCHTIGGGRLVGPDLKNVTQRKDRSWLVNFVTNPKGVLDSGDPYAQELFEKANRVPMPLAPGMTRERAEKLLDLIEEESKLEESQFKGLQISNEPFTADDVTRGRNIFLGLTPLENRGTSCISCHSTYDLKALGGGLLGPDLTDVYNRLKGRASLSNWLNAPGTETMRPTFTGHPLKPEEIHSLVAYFESASKHQPADPATNRVMFLLLGLTGATVLMFAFDAVWKWRFRGVREPLVTSGKAKGEI